MSNRRWLKILALGVVEEHARSLGALLTMLIKLKAIKSIKEIRVGEGLFGWEVRVLCDEDHID